MQKHIHRMFHRSSRSDVSSIYKEDFIRGMGKTDNGFIMILDIDKVFSASDAYALSTDTRTDI